MANKWLNAVIVICVLLAFGWWRMDYEHDLSSEMRERELLPAPMSLDTRASLKQKGLASTFGSLRPTLAAIMSLTATQYHVDSDWEDLEREYNDIVLLDPGNVNYWDLGSWHIGTNAAVSSKENMDYPPLKRQAMFEDYVRKGSAFLDQGIVMSPKEWRLPFLKARMWANIHLMPDYELVLKTLYQALEYDNVPDMEREMMERMVLYTLARIPGRSQEAYDYAYQLWSEGDSQRFPSVLSRLFILQNNPSVKIKRRLSLEELYGDKMNAYRNLRNYWKGKESADVPYGVEEALKQLESELGVRNEQRLFPYGPLK